MDFNDDLDPDDVADLADVGRKTVREDQRPATEAMTADVTGAEVTSAKAGVRPCETCGEPKPDGRRECGKCRIARYRSDPEKAERSREASRRWKAQEYERQLAAWNQRQKVGA